MPLQDVSNDDSMIGWLRQSGHGHLLENQHEYSNLSSSASPPPPPRQPPSPIISGGYNTMDHYHDSYNRSTSIPQTNNFNIQSYNGPTSPTNFISSPSQFIAPHMNQQLDIDIENMKRDPNTRVVQRPPQDDVVYRQRVFVRYLQPPTPPVSGAIIVREKQPPPPPPDPPIVIRRAAPPPPTPPPVIIRERPPPLPPPEPTTIINKIVPSQAKPPRQVIIEQFPPLPPKPQDVIIERWLPVPPRQRRILYERLSAPAINQQMSTGPIIVQHGQPRVRIHREVITAPGSQIPYQPVVSQIGTNQHIQSILSPSSLISYSPYSTVQQTYGSITHPQSNIVVMQSEQPNIISSSSYGMPLSCMCTPNVNTGLGIYGSGISTVPTMGYSSGQSIVYTVPENVSVDNVLRQLGVDTYSLQQSADPYSAVSHVWNAASHANPPHSIDPHSAVSHVWNAAAHANPSHSIDPHSAVSHVWNAAAHANDYNHSGYTGNNIQQYPQQQQQYPQQHQQYPQQQQQQYPQQQQQYPQQQQQQYPQQQQQYPQQQQYNNVPPSSGASGVLSRLFGGNQ